MECVQQACLQQWELLPGSLYKTRLSKYPVRGKIRDTIFITYSRVAQRTGESPNFDNKNTNSVCIEIAFYQSASNFVRE